jgi:hypothetical protein
MQAVTNVFASGGDTSELAQVLAQQQALMPDHINVLGGWVERVYFLYLLTIGTTGLWFVFVCVGGC